MKTIIFGLTFITMQISPSRFTHETRSTLYVTRVVFTIRRTRDVTVTTVETDIMTSCIKSTQYITCILVKADTIC